MRAFFPGQDAQADEGGGGEEGFFAGGVYVEAFGGQVIEEERRQFGPGGSGEGRLEEDLPDAEIV
jgi:hypothetical protein